MRVRPNENSRFARRFKPRARSLTFETVDYFTTFTHAPPDFGAHPGASNACGTKFLAALPALEMTCRILC
jgi:hypothetical protein